MRELKRLAMSGTTGKQGRASGERRPIFQSTGDVFELVAKLGLFSFLIYWSIVLLRPFLSIALWSLILAVTLYPAFQSGPPGGLRQAEIGGWNHHSCWPSGVHRPHYLARIDGGRGRFVFPAPQFRRHNYPAAAGGDQDLAIR